MSEKVFDNRFYLLENLGHGRLGEVYKAYNIWNKQEVALRIAGSEVDSKDAEQSFKTEFLLLKELAHPGVVEVYDFGYSEDGRPYFSMEYIKGKGINEAFKQGGYDFLYRFIWELCEVLGYLHARNIVHCDLKKDNLQIVDDLFGVKLLDFGLSERIGSRIGRQLKGTLDYMAPEVFSGGNLDGRTDLYSLGVILYEIVTSQLPFPSEDPIRVVAGHLGEEPVPPQELNPTIPLQLNELILDLLDKLPEGRPDDSFEVKHRVSKLNQGKFDAKEDKLSSSYIYSGELIGRKRELAKLEQSLKQGVYAQGKVLVLEGEMGSGKTALMEGLKSRAQLEGIPFLKTRCIKGNLVVYQPIKEILYKLFPYFKNKYDFLLNKHSHPFNLLLPELVNPEKLPKSSSHKDKVTFQQEIVDFLIEASQLVPFVICIDDVDLCKRETLDILRRLADNIHKSRIFLCCSCSTRRAGGETKQTSKRSECSLGRAERLELECFSASEIKSFLDSRLMRSPKEEVVSLLHHHSKGNPFILTEWLKFLLENRVIRIEQKNPKYELESLKEIKLPNFQRDIISKNLDRYDREMLELLCLCIFMGGRISLEELSLLTGHAKRDLKRSLSALTEEQLMRKEIKFEDGDFCYELVHQDIGEFLPDIFSSQEKRILHQRAAQHLDNKSSKKPYPPTEIIAYHFIHSEDYQKGFEYSLKAEEEMHKLFAEEKALYWLDNAYALVKKFTTRKERLKRQWEVAIKRGDLHKDLRQDKKALSDYKTALKSAQLLRNREKVAEVLQKIGAMYDSQRDTQNALSCLRESLKIYRRLKDKFIIAKTCELIGELFRKDCKYSGAVMYYRKSLALYESLNRPKEIANVLNLIGATYVMRSKYSEAKGYLKRFLELAEKIGDKEMCSKGLNNMAIICYSTGKYGDGIEYLLAALRMNQELNRKEGVFFNLENIGERFFRIGKFKQAISYSLRSLDLARQVDFSKFRGGMKTPILSLLTLGLGNFELGDYDQAIRHLREALEQAEQANDRVSKSEILVRLAGFYLQMNQLGKAGELLASAKGTIEETQDKYGLILFSEMSGLLNFKRGKLDEAISYLNKAKQLIQQTGVRDEIILVNLLLCDIYFELADLDKVNKTLKQTQSILEKSENKRYEAQYYLNLAKSEWWEGSLEQALRYLELSLVKAEKQETPELIWRVHHQIGKLCLSLDNWERAYRELEDAQKIIRGLSKKIRDEELRESYLEDKEKTELLSDIKSVVELMTGEKVLKV